MKHELAINYLKERLAPLEMDNIPEGPNKEVAQARRDEVAKELRESIALLESNQEEKA